jgi:gamma-glutamyltranspeptidase/glutathione hydrolase
LTNHIFVKPLFVLVALFLASAISSFAQVDRITGNHFATRSEVIASHGMAATAQPLAAEIAIDILKQGGSVVDAAVAAKAGTLPSWPSSQVRLFELTP